MYARTYSWGKKIVIQSVRSVGYFSCIRVKRTLCIAVVGLHGLWAIGVARRIVSKCDGDVIGDTKRWEGRKRHFPGKKLRGRDVSQGLSTTQAATGLVIPDFILLVSNNSKIPIFFMYQYLYACKKTVLDPEGPMYSIYVGFSLIYEIRTSRDV